MAGWFKEFAKIHGGTNHRGFRVLDLESAFKMRQ